MENYKRYFFIVIGSICVVLGTIGIFFPVLPTTPFLLLASFCYMKGSKKLYSWLMHHKIFGKYIYHYLTYKAVPLSTKIWALILLWAGLMVSAYLVSKRSVSLILLTIGIAVTIHILRLKTLSKENLSQEIQAAETMTKITEIQ